MRRTARICPSRNPRTAPSTSEAAAIATGSMVWLRLHPLEAHEIVDGRIARQAARLGVGIELDAGDRARHEARAARPARELGRADEPIVFMRAARQKLEHVLGADDCEQERLEIAVE